MSAPKPTVWVSFQGIAILISANLTLLLPVLRWAGDNTNLTFKQQYFRDGKSKHCIHHTTFEEYSINFLEIYMLIDFALMLLIVFDV